MTSQEYAERTRISSILRAIMLDSSPKPTISMNSTPVNQDPCPHGSVSASPSYVTTLIDPAS